MAEPTAELLHMPSGYGTTSQTLEWPTIRATLERAKQYWLATNRSDGRSPHLVPLDGMWLDDVWYFGGSAETVHAKTVAKNPNVTMHLPDPWKVVVVEGVVRKLPIDDAGAERLTEAYYAKYPEYGRPDVGYKDEAPALIPRKVLAWLTFPKDATRFLFADRP